MGSRAQQAVLKVLPEAIVDGESNDERSHARRHSDDGNDRNQSDNRLAAFGAEIAGGDEEFETHRSAISRQLLIWIIGSSAGEYGWDVVFVLPVFLAKACLELPIFQSNHPSSREDSYGCQSETNHQA